ncbi:hypothetical protein JHK84_047277 [Glycine max]|nr:hypothetical protein JHK84_047277 [Glycine max]
MKLYRLLSGVLRVKRKCNLLPGTLTFSRNSMCGMVYLVKMPSHNNGFLVHTWTGPVNIF